MTAFATASDLGVRLKQTFTPAEGAWVTSLLEDAAAFMRGVMRNQVYPSLQSTYVAYPVGGRVTLPQSFVRSVDAVTNSLGAALSYTRNQDTLHIVQDSRQISFTDPVNVTFTYGLSAPPSDLIGINCALAGQMMTTVSSGLGLTAGGLSSAAIDDYKIAFADGGAGTGLSLTTATRDYLIEHYGREVWVVAIA